MYRLLSFLCIAACLSCSKVYRIDGTSKISSIDGSAVVLKTAIGDAWKVIDSCEVLHGQFKMKGKLDSVIVATLFVDGNPLMPVVLEGGKTDVLISDMEIRAKGTPLNDSLYGFLFRKHKLELKVMELERLESQMIMNGYTEREIKEVIDSVFSKISTDMEELVCGFISENYDNVLSLCGFSMLCNGLPQPVVTPLIQRVLDEAPLSFKEKPSISEFIYAAKENMENYETAELY
ncbi:MAG: DUF4369 domain-containing protein [Bacteroidales bacterium]|nr:DUF4369 domain-containing protein [Bacteroidales bacterium]